MTESRAKAFAQALATAYKDREYFELSLHSREHLELVAEALVAEFGYGITWHADRTQIGVDKMNSFSKQILAPERDPLTDNPHLQK
jgi:hypothetical protein